MAVCLILWFVFVKPERTQNLQNNPSKNTTKIDLKFAFKNPGV